jgi:hypothetical protein
MLAALAPRNLQWSDLAGKFLEPLKDFKEQKVIIEYLPEAEPRRAAQSLAQVLRAEGWAIEGLNPNENLWNSMHSGVHAEQYNVPSFATFQSRDEFNAHVAAMWRSAKAADCVIAFLKKRRWKGLRGGWQEEGELPAGTLRIRIGTKPEPAIPRPLIEGLDDDESMQWLIDDGVQIAGPVPLPREEQRSISAEQHDTAAEILTVERQAYGEADWKMVPVEIRCPSGNDEAFRYAAQFAELLTDSGWELVGGKVVVDGEFNRMLKWVVIRADSGSGSQQFFQRGSLKRALRKAGIETRDVMQPTSDPLQILVGW